MNTILKSMELKYVTKALNFPFRLQELLRNIWMKPGSPTGTFSSAKVSDVTLSTSATDLCSSALSNQKFLSSFTRHPEHSASSFK